MKDYFSDVQPTSLSVNDRENAPVNPTQTAAPIPTSLEEIAISGAMNAIGDILKESIRCFTDYAKCKEHEKTERERITATLEAIEYQIDAQKEVYLKELDKQYEERNRLYEAVERAQNVALSIGDKEMLKICLNCMLNIYNKPIGSNGTAPSLLTSPLNSSGF